MEGVDSSVVEIDGDQATRTRGLFVEADQAIARNGAFPFGDDVNWPGVRRTSLVAAAPGRQA